MPTQLKSQQLFDSLNKALESAFSRCLYNQYDIDLQLPQLCKSPLGVFLKEVEKSAPELNCDKNFLKEIYSHAFMMGPIPRSTNHIAFTGKVTSQKNETEIALWINLDKLSTQVNQYLKIDNQPHLITNNASQDACFVSNNSVKSSFAINSIKNPSMKHSYYNILSLFTGMLSGYSLLIAALAVANLVTFGAAGVTAAVAVVTCIVAGAASSYFFKNRKGGYTKPNSPPSTEPTSTLDELFEQKFQIHHQNNPVLTHDNSQRTVADELQATDIFSEAAPLLGLN